MLLIGYKYKLVNNINQIFLNVFSEKIENAMGTLNVLH